MKRSKQLWWAMFAACIAATNDLPHADDSEAAKEEGKQMACSQTFGPIEVVHGDEK
jgi:hypothetical protein